VITAQIFKGSVPKLGNNESENEDAYRLIRSPKKGPELRELRCAMADGATQASFSRFWAQLLVDNAVKTGYVPSENKLKAIIDRSALELEKKVHEINLPWYAIEKAKRGAFSSFLWLSIKSNPDKSV
jgi:serine/threonine protein phosphatase PrpC